MRLERSGASPPGAPLPAALLNYVRRGRLLFELAAHAFIGFAYSLALVHFDSVAAKTPQNPTAGGAQSASASRLSPAVGIPMLKELQKHNNLGDGGVEIALRIEILTDAVLVLMNAGRRRIVSSLSWGSL